MVHMYWPISMAVQDLKWYTNVHWPGMGQCMARHGWSIILGQLMTSSHGNVKPLLCCPLAGIVKFVVSHFWSGQYNTYKGIRV